MQSRQLEILCRKMALHINQNDFLAIKPVCTISRQVFQNRYTQNIVFTCILGFPIPNKSILCVCFQTCQRTFTGFLTCCLFLTIYFSSIPAPFSKAPFGVRAKLTTRCNVRKREKLLYSSFTQRTNKPLALLSDDLPALKPLRKTCRNLV